MLGLYAGFKRTTSWVLVVAFLGMEVAYAAPSMPAAALISIQPLESLAASPLTFEAPIDFVSVKELHRGDKNIFIIHIQDAHSNSSGQQNLAGALDSMMKKYGISLVLSEGGANDCSLTPLKKIASQDIWKRVAKSYLLEGKLSGEEYLNLVSDRPMKIVGIENMDQYLVSLENYSRLADRREAALAYLTRIRLNVQKLKNRFYPEELSAFEERLKKSNGSYETRVKGLLSLAASHNIVLDEFVELAKLAGIQKKERDINFEVANLEQAVLVEEIAKRGGEDDLQKFMKKSDQLKGERLSQLAYFQNTLNIARSKNIVVDNYKNYLAYGEYLKEFVDLDLELLLDEIQKAEDKVYLGVLEPSTKVPGTAVDGTKVDGTYDARMTRAIDRYTALLETAYRIQMTTKEFALFRVNEPDFATVPYVGFLNRKLAQFGYYEDILAYDDVLEKAKLSLEAFYASVGDRDLSFVKNAECTMTDEKQPVAVVITGGYHTPHLTQLWKEKGYSYVVLTPYVTGETNQTKYERLLLAPVRKDVKTVETVQGENKKDKSLAVLDADLSRAKDKTDGARVALAALDGARLAALADDAMAFPSASRSKDVEEKALQAVANKTQAARRSLWREVGLAAARVADDKTTLAGKVHGPRVLDESDELGYIGQFDNMHSTDLVLKTQSFIDRVVSTEARPVRILDLGSGSDMSLVRILRKKFGEKIDAYGVDDHESDNVPGYIRADANDAIESLLAKGEQFDIIISHRAFAFFKDREKAMLGVAQLLAPGGWASIHWMSSSSDGQREKNFGTRGNFYGGIDSLNARLNGAKAKELSGLYYHEGEFELKNWKDGKFLKSRYVMREDEDRVISDEDEYPLRVSTPVIEIEKPLAGARVAESGGLKNWLGPAAWIVLAIAGVWWLVAAQSKYNERFVLTKAAPAVPTVQKETALKKSKPEAPVQRSIEEDRSRHEQQRLANILANIEVRKGEVDPDEKIALAKVIAEDPTNETSEIVLSDVVKAFRTSFANVKTSEDADRALRDFERCVRIGLSMNWIKGHEAATSLDELNEQVLIPNGYLINQSPNGLSDERAFVLYKIDKKETRHTDQGDVPVYYVSQVTLGVLRGNPGWTPIFPILLTGRGYVVVFSELIGREDEKNAAVLKLTPGQLSFGSSKRGVSIERQMQITRMAGLHDALLKKGFGGLSPETRKEIAEESTAAHEADHWERLMRLSKWGLLMEGMQIHGGLLEETAVLRSMLEEHKSINNVEPFHVLAGIVKIAAATGEDSFAWSILRRLTGKVETGEVLGELQKFIEGMTSEELRGRVNAAYEGADKEWRAKYKKGARVAKMVRMRSVIYLISELSLRGVQFDLNSQFPESVTRQLKVKDAVAANLGLSSRERALESAWVTPRGEEAAFAVAISPHLGNAYQEARIYQIEKNRLGLVNTHHGVQQVVFGMKDGRRQLAVAETNGMQLRKGEHVHIIFYEASPAGLKLVDRKICFATDEQVKSRSFVIVKPDGTLSVVAGARLTVAERVVTDEGWRPLPNTVALMRYRRNTGRGGDEAFYRRFFDDRTFQKEAEAAYADSELIPASIHTYYDNGSPFSENAIIELITNALDAIVGGKSTGRFGVGAYQMFQELKRPTDSIVITTSVDGRTGLRLIFQLVDGEIAYRTETVHEGVQQGTRVDVNVPLSEKQISDKKAFIRSKLKTNTRGRINFVDLPDRRTSRGMGRVFAMLRYWAGEVVFQTERINKPESYRYINGEPLSIPVHEAVGVAIDRNGYSVIDHGTGMSAKILFEKFLVPKESTKRTDGQTLESPEEIRSEVKVFYARDASLKPKTSRIAIQVSGVMIREITVRGVELPAEIIVEMPHDTWLPESRDKVALDKITREGILAVFEKLATREGADMVQDRYALINALMALVSRLAQENGEPRFLFDCRNAIKPLIEAEKADGTLILPNRAEFLSLKTGGQKRIFLDESLYEFRPQDIPGAQEVTNFSSKKNNKLYLVDLDTAGDGPIYFQGQLAYGRGGWVLLDRGEYERHKDNPLFLNTLLNLGVDYGDEGLNSGEISAPRSARVREGAVPASPATAGFAFVRSSIQPGTVPPKATVTKSATAPIQAAVAPEPSQFDPEWTEFLRLDKQLLEAANKGPLTNRELLSQFTDTDRHFILQKLWEPIEQGVITKENLGEMKDRLEIWLTGLLKFKKTAPEGMLSDHWVRDELFKSFVTLFQSSGAFIGRRAKAGGRYYFKVDDLSDSEALGNVYEVDELGKVTLIAERSTFFVHEDSVYLITNDPKTEKKQVSVRRGDRNEVLADNVLLHLAPETDSRNGAFVIFQEESPGGCILIKTLTDGSLHDFAVLDQASVAIPMMMGTAPDLKRFTYGSAILDGSGPQQRLYIMPSLIYFPGGSNLGRSKEIHRIDMNGKVSPVAPYTDKFNSVSTKDVSGFEDGSTLVHAVETRSETVSVPSDIPQKTNTNGEWSITLAATASMLTLATIPCIALYDASGRLVAKEDTDGGAWVHGNFVYFQSQGDLMRMDSSGRKTRVLEGFQNADSLDHTQEDTTSGTNAARRKLLITDIQFVGDTLYVLTRATLRSGESTRYISQVHDVRLAGQQVGSLGWFLGGKEKFIRIKDRIYFFSEDLRGDGSFSLAEMNTDKTNGGESWTNIKGKIKGYEVCSGAIYVLVENSMWDMEIHKVQRPSTGDGASTVELFDQPEELRGGMKYQPSEEKGYFHFTDDYGVSTSAFVANPDLLSHYQYDIRTKRFTRRVAYRAEKDETNLSFGALLISDARRRLRGRSSAPLLLERKRVECFKNNVDTFKYFLPKIGYLLSDMTKEEKERLISSLISAENWSPALIFLDMDLAPLGFPDGAMSRLLESTVLEAKNIEEIREFFKFVATILAVVNDAKLAVRVIERWHRLHSKNPDLARAVSKRVMPDPDSATSVTESPLGRYVRGHSLDTLPQDVLFYLSYLTADEIKVPSVLQSEPLIQETKKGDKRIENRRLAALIWLRYQFSKKINRPGVTWEDVLSAAAEVDDKKLDGIATEYAGAVNGQDKQMMFFIRELFQNARDAVWKAQKLGTQSGFLGHGFYTVFAGGIPGATRVRMRTGDGVNAYVLVFEPVYNANGDVEDINMISMEPDEVPSKGTRIERVIEIDDPTDEEAVIGAMNMTCLVKRYLGAIPGGGERGVSIFLNGELQNEDGVDNKDPERTIHIQNGITGQRNARGKYEWVFSITDPVGMDLNVILNKLLPVDVSGKPSQTVSGGLDSHLSPERTSRVTVDDLYVDDVNENYNSLIPASVLAILLSRGWNLNFPQGTPVPRTRNGVKDAAQYAPAVAAEALRALVKVFLTDRQVDLPELPPDYLFSQSNAITVRADIIADGESINAGNPEQVDWSKYKNDAHALVQLLSCIQVDYEGSPTSLRGIKERVLAEYRKTSMKEVDLSFIPKGLEGLVGATRSSIENKMTSKRISVEPIRGERILEAFSAFIKELNKRGDRGGDVAGNKVDFEIVVGAGHAASASGNTLTWNLGDLRNLRAFLDLMRGRGDGDDLRNLIQGYVHETAHTMEHEIGKTHGNMWTHIASQDVAGAFGWIMKHYLMRLIKNMESVDEFRRKLKESLGVTDKELGESYDRVADYIRRAPAEGEPPAAELAIGARVAAHQQGPGVGKISLDEPFHFDFSFKISPSADREERTRIYDALLSEFSRRHRSELQSKLPDVGLELDDRIWELEIKSKNGSLDLGGIVIHNAIDAIADEARRRGVPYAGTISLEIRHERGQTVIECSDNGVGFNKDHLAGFFNRAIATTKPELSFEPVAKSLGGGGTGHRQYFPMVGEWGGRLELETKQEGSEPYAMVRDYGLTAGKPELAKDDGVLVSEVKLETERKNPQAPSDLVVIDPTGSRKRVSVSDDVSDMVLKQLLKGVSSDTDPRVRSLLQQLSTLESGLLPHTSVSSFKTALRFMINNSSKAIDESGANNGTIEISARVIGGSFVIQLKDSGNGLDGFDRPSKRRNDEEAVPVNRLSNGTTVRWVLPDGPKIGFFLYRSRAFVESVLKGSVEGFDNHKDLNGDKGATFTISIPFGPTGARVADAAFDRGVGKIMDDYTQEAAQVWAHLRTELSDRYGLVLNNEDAGGLFRGLIKYARYNGRKNYRSKQSQRLNAVLSTILGRPENSRVRQLQELAGKARKLRELAGRDVQLERALKEFDRLPEGRGAVILFKSNHRVLLEKTLALRTFADEYESATIADPAMARSIRRLMSQLYVTVQEFTLSYAGYYNNSIDYYLVLLQELLGSKAPLTPGNIRRLRHILTLQVLSRDSTGPDLSFARKVLMARINRGIEPIAESTPAPAAPPVNIVSAPEPAPSDKFEANFRMAGTLVTLAVGPKKIVMSSDGLEAEYDLKGTPDEVVTIGRSSGCNLFLPLSRLVSGKHARLQRINDEWVLFDNSTNGTTNAQDIPIPAKGVSLRTLIASGARVASVETFKGGEFKMNQDGEPVILIVEDNRDTLMVMPTILSRNIGRGVLKKGQFVIATNYEAARQVISAAQARGLLKLVVTDGEFPEKKGETTVGLFGPQIIKSVKKLDASIPVVWMGSHTWTDLGEKVAGIQEPDERLAKPLDWDVFIALLEEKTREASHGVSPAGARVAKIGERQEAQLRELASKISSKKKEFSNGPLSKEETLDSERALKRLDALNELATKIASSDLMGEGDLEQYLAWVSFLLKKDAKMLNLILASSIGQRFVYQVGEQLKKSNAIGLLTYALRILSPLRDENYGKQFRYLSGLPIVIEITPDVSLSHVARVEKAAQIILKSGWYESHPESLRYIESLAFFKKGEKHTESGFIDPFIPGTVFISGSKHALLENADTIVHEGQHLANEHNKAFNTDLMKRPINKRHVWLGESKNVSAGQLSNEAFAYGVALLFQLQAAGNMRLSTTERRRIAKRYSEHMKNFHAANEILKAAVETSQGEDAAALHSSVLRLWQQDIRNAARVLRLRAAGARMTQESNEGSSDGEHKVFTLPGYRQGPVIGKNIHLMNNERDQAVDKFPATPGPAMSGSLAISSDLDALAVLPDLERLSAGQPLYVTVDSNKEGLLELAVYADLFPDKTFVGEAGMQSRRLFTLTLKLREGSGVPIAQLSVHDLEDFTSRCSRFKLSPPKDLLQNWLGANGFIYGWLSRRGFSRIEVQRPAHWVASLISTLKKSGWHVNGALFIKELGDVPPSFGHIIGLWSHSQADIDSGQYATLAGINLNEIAKTLGLQNPSTENPEGRSSFLNMGSGRHRIATTGKISVLNIDTVPSAPTKDAGSQPAFMQANIRDEGFGEMLHNRLAQDDGHQWSRPINVLLYNMFTFIKIYIDIYHSSPVEFLEKAFEQVGEGGYLVAVHFQGPAGEPTDEHTLEELLGYLENVPRSEIAEIHRFYDPKTLHLVGLAVKKAGGTTSPEGARVAVTAAVAKKAGKRSVEGEVPSEAGIKRTLAYQQKDESENQDSHFDGAVKVKDIPNGVGRLLGVADGHGKRGGEVSALINLLVFGIFSRKLAVAKGNVAKAMKDTIDQLHIEIQSAGLGGSGTTLSMCYAVTEKNGAVTVYAATVGDSPLVIVDSRNGEVVSMPFHNTFNPIEAAAVKRGGATITADGYVQGTVDEGGLAITRSLGDANVPGIRHEISENEVRQFSFNSPVEIYLLSDGLLLPGIRSNVQFNQYVSDSWLGKNKTAEAILNESVEAADRQEQEAIAAYAAAENGTGRAKARIYIDDKTVMKVAVTPVVSAPVFEPQPSRTVGFSSGSAISLELDGSGTLTIGRSVVLPNNGGIGFDKLFWKKTWEQLLDLNGKSYAIGRAKPTGRPEDNDWVFLDEGVSNYHAKLTITARRDPDTGVMTIKVSIEDLGSTNGTFVDEARVTKMDVLTAQSKLVEAASSAGTETAVGARLPSSIRQAVIAAALSAAMAVPVEAPPVQLMPFYDLSPTTQITSSGIRDLNEKNVAILMDIAASPKHVFTAPVPLLMEGEGGGFALVTTPPGPFTFRFSNVAGTETAGARLTELREIGSYTIVPKDVAAIMRIKAETAKANAASEIQAALTAKAGNDSPVKKAAGKMAWIEHLAEKLYKQKAAGVSPASPNIRIIFQVVTGSSSAIDDRTKEEIGFIRPQRDILRRIVGENIYVQTGYIAKDAAGKPLFQPHEGAVSNDIPADGQEAVVIVVGERNADLVKLAKAEGAGIAGIPKIGDGNMFSMVGVGMFHIMNTRFGLTEELKQLWKNTREDGCDDLKPDDAKKLKRVPSSEDTEEFLKFLARFSFRLIEKLSRDEFLQAARLSLLSIGAAA